MQQVIYTELEEERNELGELTGVVKAYGVVVANRTSLAYQSVSLSLSVIPMVEYGMVGRVLQRATLQGVLNDG